jgi:carbonic anhydrase
MRAGSARDETRNSADESGVKWTLPGCKVVGDQNGRVHSGAVAGHGPSLTADEAFARLKEGNERFVAGHAKFPTVQKEVLADLAKGQRPYATIIGCSDSRVPPELVFDSSFGELFIVRVAGNVISPEVMGSIQYAAVHLQTQLFLVLGHDGCGAVQAALANVREGVRERSRIALLLDRIVPGISRVDASLPPDAQVAAAVEANVRWSMQQLLETPEGRARVEEGILKLVGGVYELTTGRVRFLL